VTDSARGAALGALLAALAGAGPAAADPALGAPTVGVYCGTNPAATGIYGCARSVNLGGIGRAPTPAQVITAVEKLAS